MSCIPELDPIQDPYCKTHNALLINILFRIIMEPAGYDIMDSCASSSAQYTCFWSTLEINSNNAF